MCEGFGIQDSGFGIENLVVSGLCAQNYALD